MTIRRITFSVLPAQRQFLESDSFQVIYIGGYGSGKTYASAMKALSLSLINPGLIGMLLAPTQRMVQDITGAAFLDLVRRHKLPHKYSVTEGKVIFDWGSQVWFRSADRPDRLKGANLAWAGLDEAAQMKEEAWQVMISRIRHRRASLGQLFLTTTPEGFNWVYRRFVEDPLPETEVITSPTAQNSFLSPDYITRLRRAYPPELAAQYLDGRFVNMTTGRVYHAFSRGDHVRAVEPWPGEPIHLACDFNVNPMIWLAVQHRDGLVRVVGELVLDQADTAQAAARFAEQWLVGQEAVEVFGDAAGAARDTRQVGRTDYTIIKEVLPDARIRTPRANPPVKDRINAVNSRLRNANGEINMVISPNCRELIMDLEQLVYGHGQSLIDKSDPRRSHASDALGYFVCRVYPIRGRIRGFRY